MDELELYNKGMASQNFKDIDLFLFMISLNHMVTSLGTEGCELRSVVQSIFLYPLIQFQCKHRGPFQQVF